MNMSINFDLQIYCSSFEHQDLWYKNVEKEVNLGSILKNGSYLITLMERLLVEGNMSILSLRKVLTLTTSGTSK